MTAGTAEQQVTAARIEARDVIVDYQTDQGTIRALECSEFTVEPGANVAIMGPSGCGKSTLLGLLAGLSVPTRGTVAVGGTNVSSLSEQERIRFRRRSLGMVYQADNLLPHLTVEENVGLQLAICRSELSADRRTDPTEVLERLGLADLARRLPDQLSGGQRQRVAVARAIVHRPPVILADEPTGALDGDNAERVIELLLEVQRETEATMVVVTHDPDIGSRLDRTVLLARPVQTRDGDDAH